jgi:hypothetical protein
VRGLSIVILAACVGIGASPADAQQSVDYASVSGRVTDPSGAVLRDARVTARHTETNVTSYAVTDEEGASVFRISESDHTRLPSAGKDSPIRHGS